LEVSGDNLVSQSLQTSFYHVMKEML